ncbi:hypothetical protein B0H16DRAFT_1878940 [Mycena metata]|uniref:Uncharacterized protein n=1 Tax=Mycena metata TaxID=1033252 RepID=A0AAD7K6P2_9AGAR|nr:hypothetical protein B0H16DRAFT_1878940 [Mycena metata]
MLWHVAGHLTTLSLVRVTPSSFILLGGGSFHHPAQPELRARWHPRCIPPPRRCTFLALTTPVTLFAPWQSAGEARSDEETAAQRLAEADAETQAAMTVPLANTLNKKKLTPSAIRPHDRTKEL